MSTSFPSQRPDRPMLAADPLLAPSVPTLATTMATIAADPTLTPTQRAQQTSAIRVFCRAVRREPSTLPAATAALRPLLRHFHPAAADLTERRWRNILSLLRQAIGRHGMPDGRLPRLMPMAPEWTALYQRLDGWAARAGLSHFLRYLSARGIGPADVDDAVSNAYLRFLETASLKPNPRATHQMVCHGWNRAVATLPGWPPRSLAVPRYRQTYMLPATGFPASLVAEIDQWCDRIAGKDPMADDLPRRLVTPRTAKTRAYQMRQLASALVHRGHDPANLRSLADVARLEPLREAMRFFLERAGGIATKQMVDLVAAAAAVAHHWLRVPADELRRMKALRRRILVPRRGMTERNRAILRQFDDPRALAALFSFGPDQFAEARRRDDGSARTARRAAIALAVELLIWCPIRISNLIGIHLDDHICRARSDDGPVHLAIPAGEVKNREPLEFPLLPHLARMIDDFTRHFRPRLAPPASRFLFAGKHGHVERLTLGETITRRIFDVTGLRMNPHVFRHLGAMLYLRENPGGFEVVRRTLAHRDPSTTINAYMGLETRAATRHFDETILRVRARVLKGKNNGTPA
jgi:integrase